MQTLGHTRGSLRRDHYLQTPDTFIRTPLPGMQAATAVVYASPASGAQFFEYTAEMEVGGVLGRTPYQRFVYVLSGLVEIRYESFIQVLQPAGFAYMPSGVTHFVLATQNTRIVVIEKQYEALHNVDQPEFFARHEPDISSQALMGDSALQVKLLLPDSLEYDFAVNTMTFEPGAALGMVEMHVMEHGLLMLEGGGIYRLGDSWYPVSAGDFIYMAPYCPQWFGALGKTPAKYLIYKDANRAALL